MTDVGGKHSGDPLVFYDLLAADYDALTGFESRFDRERPAFQAIVNRYRIRTAMDAGSGTGFHSLLLAQLGVAVTAVDISQKMLDGLAAHAKSMNLSVAMVESSFDSLQEKAAGRFDALFCLGNTLPHALTAAGLRRAMESFASVIRPGGSLFVQLLNYDRILALRERVQNVKECGAVTYVRFYDYDQPGGLIMFNLLKLEKKESVQHSLMTVPLLPIRSGELRHVMEATHFDDLRFYGGIAMEKYDEGVSRDLFVVATRSRGGAQ